MIIHQMRLLDTLKGPAFDLSDIVYIFMWNRIYVYVCYIDMYVIIYIWLPDTLKGSAFNLSDIVYIYMW